jgi:hypothetical protein
MIKVETMAIRAIATKSSMRVKPRSCLDDAAFILPECAVSMAPFDRVVDTVVMSKNYMILPCFGI